jgi:methionyl-tRNA formyltransferase
MKKLNKLAFFGNERLATGLSPTKTPTLQALIGAGYEICVTVSNYTKGRSRTARELEIAEVAKAHKIPLLTPEKLINIKEDLSGFGAEAAVLVAYGQIIPQAIIDIFPKGIINIHPSLLPKYRGPTPLETVILDDTHETGVSIMQLTAGMDAGPVFAQAKLKLSGHETKDKLAEKLLNLGGKLLMEHLPYILDGLVKPTPQDNSQATYTKLLKKADGLINWQKPAEVLEREVRAYAGFPKSRARISGHEVVITKSRVAQDDSDGDLVMACRPGYLEIMELIAPSGRVISGADFLRGYHKTTS